MNGKPVERAALVQRGEDLRGAANPYQFARLEAELRRGVRVKNSRGCAHGLKNAAIWAELPATGRAGARRSRAN